MNDYLYIFVDSEYPKFLDKYLNTKTMERLKYVTQFCGCDYTKLYNPLFLYTRFDHSLVVAHMTWHFTHDKESTIVALLHDVGTPCFAHTIDYVYGDYLNQESSERKIVDMLKDDEEIIKYLKEDSIDLNCLNDLAKYPILENKSPRLCCDRLDGVLHTCYVWLHTHTLSYIKEVYDDMCVLKNEDNVMEIGFNSASTALKFCQMVSVYAKELQGNRDKYVMKYISELVKKASEKGLISLDDLYSKKESEIIQVFENNFSSWAIFNSADNLVCTNNKPDYFYISFDTKKRNTVPLVKTDVAAKRITEILSSARTIYEDIDAYHDTKYAYIADIKKVQ